MKSNWNANEWKKKWRSANVTLKSEYKRIESTRNYNGSFVPAYNAAEPTFDGDIFSIGADFVF